MEAALNRERRSARAGHGAQQPEAGSGGKRSPFAPPALPLRHRPKTPCPALFTGHLAVPGGCLLSLTYVLASQHFKTSLSSVGLL